MHWSPSTNRWVAQLALVVLTALGLVGSGVVLAHASATWCAVVNAGVVLWYVVLSVLISAASRKWRAFAIAALVATWSHSWIAKDGRLVPSEPFHFPTNVVLATFWTLVCVPNDPATVGWVVGDAFVPHPLDGVNAASPSFTPPWFYFSKLGVALISLWLGLLVGTVALAVRSFVSRRRKVE